MDELRFTVCVGIDDCRRVVANSPAERASCDGANGISRSASQSPPSNHTEHFLSLEKECHLYDFLDWRVTDGKQPNTEYQVVVGSAMGG